MSQQQFQFAGCRRSDEEQGERDEEARHRRRCRCDECGCLHEPGHSCRWVSYDKATGQFVHEHFKR